MPEENDVCDECGETCVDGGCERCGIPTTTEVNAYDPPEPRMPLGF